MSEFHAYLERKPIVQVVVQGQPVEAQVLGSIGFQGLRDLINRRLLLQIAKDEGVFPTPPDIEKELTFKTKRTPDFVRRLTQQGMTLEQIKSDLTLDLARERVLTKGITVTAAEADQFIKDNPKQFSVPAQARLQYIIVGDTKVRDMVDRELRSGKAFGLVAAQYSIAQDARQNQGQFPESVIDRMPPALQALVDKTAELKMTDWKQEQDKFVKFYVVQKTASRKMPIDENLKEAVRRELAVQKGSRASELGKRLQDKLKKARIDVKLSQLQAPWKQAFDSLKQQDVDRGAQGTSATGETGGTNTGAAEQPKGQ